MDFSASAVLQRIRNSLQNPANRLEGGFCMDNAQAVSEELARLDLMEVKPIPDRVLLDTAAGEYLDRKALDYNETRNPAEAAVGNLLFTGEPGTAIPIGTEALYGSLVFETTAAARISAEGYCEDGGQCGRRNHQRPARGHRRSKVCYQHRPFRRRHPGRER